MPTKLQREAFRLVEGSRTLGEALIKAGYSKNTAIKPSQVTKSVGFQELCEKVGLTDKLITSALTADIIAKPKNRVAELTLAARMKGHLKNEESSGQQIVIHIANSIAQQNNLIKKDAIVNVSDNTDPSPGSNSVRPTPIQGS